MFELIFINANLLRTINKDPSKNERNLLSSCKTKLIKLTIAAANKYVDIVYYVYFCAIKAFIFVQT